MTQKNIVLCADDYGQSPSISQAVIELIKLNRLSATSCMVTSTFWPEHAGWLENLQDKVDIGLHFNLTEGRWLTKNEVFPSLGKLLLNTYLRKLNFNDILAELNAQLACFESNMGKLPDHLDGHQHIHQLPIIREAVFKVYEQRLKNQPKFYIRCVNDPQAFYRFKDSAYFKQIIIQLCGSFAFKKQLLQLRIPHNASFAGIYDFREAKKYAMLFDKFLSYSKNNGLIMCHPGLGDNASSSDPIYYSRRDEYDYFLSDQFVEAWTKHQVAITPFVS